MRASLFDTNSFCRSEYDLLRVVSGRGLIRGGRGDFEVHPGDHVVVPFSSPNYVIINNGNEVLHLEPAANTQTNVKMDKK